MLNVASFKGQSPRKQLVSRATAPGNSEKPCNDGHMRVREDRIVDPVRVHLFQGPHFRSKEWVAAKTFCAFCTARICARMASEHRDERKHGSCR